VPKAARCTSYHRARLSLTNNDADENPYNFAIQGNGNANPEPEIDISGNGQSIMDGDTTPTNSTHTDFGAIVLGSGSITRTFTIINNGNTDLVVGTVGLAGANASDFSVTQQPSSPIAASGGSSTFQVVFTPSATGIRTAEVSLTNSDGDENPYNFTIQGNSTLTAEPEIDITGNNRSITDGDSSPTTIDHTDFGEAVINSGKVSRIFTIINNGTANLNLTGNPRVTLGGANAGDFSVNVQPNSPVTSGGSSTTFQITFAPTAVGLRTGEVSITNDDSNETPYNFTIQGSGTLENVYLPLVTKP
jgi:hypothetical protein